MATQNNPATPTYYTADDAAGAMNDMPVGAIVAVDDEMWTKTESDTWSGPSDEAPSDAISHDVHKDNPLLRIDMLPEVRAAIEAGVF